jgi:hypothetical protein
MTDDSLTTTDRQSPVHITPTWDAARSWLEGAKRMEQGKLFCQVMFGFTLQALHKEHGIKHGGERGASSHDGNLVGDKWEDIVSKETGLGLSTAYRYVDMAKAALPRLRKLPALKNFDPATQPICALSSGQHHALEVAVKKITNGQTQKEFGESLGLWKKIQGSGAKGRKPGEGGRKKLSLGEQAELLLLQATEDWKSIDLKLGVYGVKFMVPGISDTDIAAQVARLESAISARKTWLKQPHNQRDKKFREQIEGMVKL